MTLNLTAAPRRRKAPGAEDAMARALRAWRRRRVEFAVLELAAALRRERLAREGAA